MLMKAAIKNDILEEKFYRFPDFKGKGIKIFPSIKSEKPRETRGIIAG